MPQYARERTRYAPRSRPERREQINVWLAEDRRPAPEQGEQPASRPFLLVILEPERTGPARRTDPARTETQPRK